MLQSPKPGSGERVEAAAPLASRRYLGLHSAAVAPASSVAHCRQASPQQSHRRPRGKARCDNAAPSPSGAMPHCSSTELGVAVSADSRSRSTAALADSPRPAPVMSHVVVSPAVVHWPRSVPTANAVHENLPHQCQTTLADDGADSPMPPSEADDDDADRLHQRSPQPCQGPAAVSPSRRLRSRAAVPSPPGVVDAAQWQLEVAEKAEEEQHEAACVDTALVRLYADHFHRFRPDDPRHRRVAGTSTAISLCPYGRAGSLNFAAYADFLGRTTPRAVRGAAAVPPRHLVPLSPPRRR